MPHYQLAHHFSTVCSAGFSLFMHLLKQPSPSAFHTPLAPCTLAAIVSFRMQFETFGVDHFDLPYLFFGK